MIKVIIDTSGWIESFKRGGDDKLKRLVKRLITQEQVLIPNYAIIWDYIKCEVVPCLKSDFGIWQNGVWGEAPE